METCQEYFYSNFQLYKVHLSTLILAGLSGQTFTKIIGGTPGFIPRQQVLKFKESQPDVDIWASAACLYNMLTGYFPRNFTKDPFIDVLENDPVPILQRNRNIPKKLAQVIDLALIEKPQIYFDKADSEAWR